MSNVFDSANYPGEVPAILKKGGYWAWKKSDLASDYPLTSYSLKYKFNLISGSTASNFTVNATESDDSYIFEVSSTSSQTAGEYKWEAIIVRDSDSIESVIKDGYLNIIDDAVRSHTKVVLDSITAVIEGRATMDQSSMSIGNRSLSRLSIDELFEFRDSYEKRWEIEKKRSRVKNGLPSGNTIGVKF